MTILHVDCAYRDTANTACNALNVMCKAERQALKQDVARAQSQLAEAHATSQAADSAAQSSREDKAAAQQALATARSG